MAPLATARLSSMKSDSPEICSSVIFAIVRMKSSLKSSSHQGRARLRPAGAVSLIGGGARGLVPADGTMTRAARAAGAAPLPDDADDAGAAAEPGGAFE